MWEKREQIEIKEVEMAILFGRERLLKAHLRMEIHNSKQSRSDYNVTMQIYKIPENIS